MTGLIFGLSITLFLCSFIASAFYLGGGYIATSLLLAVFGSIFGVISWKIVKNDDGDCDSKEEQCHPEICEIFRPIDGERNCYNCAYYQKDGGDRVPYGSTFAITPEVEYCELNEDEDDVTPLEPCDLWEKRK